MEDRLFAKIFATSCAVEHCGKRIQSIILGVGAEGWKSAHRRAAQHVDKGDPEMKIRLYDAYARRSFFKSALLRRGILNFHIPFGPCAILTFALYACNA